MARCLTMLTFALVTATQTAQAFPHYTDFGGSRLTDIKTRESASGRLMDAAEIDDLDQGSLETIDTDGIVLGSSISGDYLQAEKRFATSMLRDYLLLLEIIAEEDPELACMLQSELDHYLQEVKFPAFTEDPTPMTQAAKSTVRGIDIPRHRFRGCVPTDPLMLRVPLKRQKP